MSSSSKKHKASQESISALEEALSLAAKELTPEERSELEREKLHHPQDDELFESEEKAPIIAVERPKPFKEEVFAAPTNVANDDKSEVGQLLHLLNKKPSQTPIYWAIGLSLTWAAAALVLSALSGLTNTTHGMLFAFMLVTIPPMVIVALSAMIYRMNEMRMVTRSMGEVALRLAEPENVAREHIASVGQAVRREVDAMNMGMTNTLHLANELERRMSSEVSQIEAAFNSSESRIGALVEELGKHRANLSNETGSVQSLLSNSHTNILEEFSAKTNDLKANLDVWNEQLEKSKHQILSSFEEKSLQLSDNLSRAGDTVLDNIHMRSTDILDKMTSTGDTVVSKLLDANAEMSEKIHATSENIVSTLVQEVAGVKFGLENAASQLTTSLNDHSATMVSSLTRTGNEVAESIAMRANEVNQTLKHTGDSLVLDLGLRGTEVTQKLDETGTRIAEYITDKGNSLADRIADTGNKLYETVNVHGSELDKRLAQTGASIAENLSKRMYEAQEAINGHAGAFRGDLESVGLGIIDNFAIKSTDLSDRISVLSSEFTERLSGESIKMNDAFSLRLAEVERVINVNGSTLASQIGNTSAEMSNIMKGHVSGFEEMSNRLSLDVALKLTEATSGMSESIRTELTNFDEKVSNKASEIAATLDARVSKLDEAINNGTHNLNTSLAQRALDIAKALSEGGQTVSSQLENKSLEMTRALTIKVDEINSALGAKVIEVAASLDSSMLKVAENSNQISMRTEALALLFDDKGGKFIESLGAKSDAITSIFDDKGGKFIESFGSKSDALTSLFDDKGGKFIDNFASKSDAITSLFDEKGVQFIDNLVIKSDAMTEQLTRISDVVTQSIEARGNAITDTLVTRSTEVTKAMAQAGLDLAQTLQDKTAGTVSTVTTTTDGIMAALLSTQDKVTVNVGGLIEALNKSNDGLKNLTINAQNNLLFIDETLGKRTVDLQKVVDNVTIASDTSVANLDSKVEALKQVSTGTLTTLADLSLRVGQQTSDLDKMSQFFSQVQEKFNSVLDERRTKLDQLVEHLGDRSTAMEQMLARFNENMTKQLEQAQSKSQELVVGLSMAAHEQTSKIGQHVETLNFAYSKERDNSQALMQTAYDTTLQNINSLYQDSAGKFNDLTGQLREVSNSISKELEVTRQELKRGLVELPRETQDQATSMRRVVAEQIKALAELNEIIGKSGKSYDVAEPTYASGGYENRRYAQPLSQVENKVSEPLMMAKLDEPAYEIPKITINEKPKREKEVLVAKPLPVPQVQPISQVQPILKAQERKPVELPETTKSESWISGLLARATHTENEEKRERVPVKKRAAASTLFDELPHEIQVLIDHKAVLELWDRYRAGEQSAFSRRIYTLEGQKRYDEVRYFYKEDNGFRMNCDRFIDDFERMLADVNRDSRDPNITRNILVSDSGKTYTLLAHASGRFDSE